jgi:hypothetical protein
MRAVDLAETLRQTLEAKINKTRREILDRYLPIEVERMEAQIIAYQWVKGRIQDIVIENEDRDTKVMM